MSIDTVSDLPRRVQYVAAAAQTSFDYPFPIFTDADLTVDVDGVIASLDTDYTVAGEGDDTGGTITWTGTAFTGGEIVTIYSDMVIERLTDIEQNGPWSSSAYNDEQDKTYLILRELKDSIARCLRIPIAAEVDDEDIELDAATWADKYVTIDANGKPAPAVLSATTITQAVIGNLLFPRTAAEISASVVPTVYSSVELDVVRYGGLFNNSSDDTAAIQKAIDVASVAVSGSQGRTVLLPAGTAIISSTLTLPNTVRFLGQNKNGTVLKAAASWVLGAVPYMLHATNGTSSMFDSLLEHMTIDANDVAGLGCIRTDGWQENCGTRHVLLYNFTTHGILYSQTGYATSGGAAFSLIEDTEMFASADGALAGVKLEEISSIGSFVLTMKRCTITGVSGTPLPAAIDIAKDSANLELCHFEYCTSGINVAGVGRLKIDSCTGGPSVTNLIKVAAGFTGKLSAEGCLRAGATYFLSDARSGGLGDISGRDIQKVILGGSDSQLVADNVCHAWCEFDGTATGTNAPTAGYNVTSVTRNAQGDFTVTFTYPLRSTHADLSVSTNIDSADGWWFSNQGFGLGSANFTIRRGGAFAGAKVDASVITVSVRGRGT
jgi:hypothetical protein